MMQDRSVKLLIALLMVLSFIALGAAQERRGSWSDRGPEFGGRLTGIVASKTDPNLLIVGSPGGGVWRSTDGGKNWGFPKNAGLADPNITHLEWDITGGNRLFALTWNGLYASTNNGDSWTGLINSGGAPGLRTAETVQLDDPKPFVQLSFSGKQRAVLAAAPCSGIYYSFDGTRFTQHWPFPGEAKNPDNCITVMAADPVSHTVYIASSVRSGAAHLFKSACEGGAWAPGKPCLTWTKANTGIPSNAVIRDIAWVGESRGARASPGAMVALLTTNGADGTIYISRDGTSWRSQGDVPKPAWTSRALIAPGTGQDLFQGNVLSLYSRDLGATWTPFKVNNQHPDVRDIYADPRAGKLWVVDDGSSSGGNSNIMRWDWRPGSAPMAGTGVDLGHKGLRAWQIYFAGVARTGNRAAPTRVFLGSQDNGSLCSDSLAVDGWNTHGGPSGGGDVFAYQAAPSNPNRAYALGDDPGFARTNNAGSGASCQNVVWTFVKPSGSFGGLNYWSHHALAVHPTNPDAIYLAFFSGVGVIMNAGASAPTLTNHPLPNRAQPTVVYVDAKGTIYAGTGSSGAFISKDNGNTWSPWAMNANPPLLISVIVSSGGASPTFWLGTSKGLFRKLPGKTDWDAMETHSGYAVSDVKVDPGCPSRLYAAYGFAGTWGQQRGGIDFSSDNGSTWTSITSGSGMHDAPITDVEIDPSRNDRLIVATYGRGLWVYDWGTSLPPCRR